MRVRVYIDGFNFYHRAKSHVATCEPDLAWRWVDIRKVVQLPTARHWQEAVQERVYYFTAPVKMRWAGDEAGARQERYLRLLAKLDVRVVRGQFRLDASRMWRITDENHPRSLVVPHERVLVQKTEEKGSDVNLATQMLVDYFTDRDSFDRSVVVSNDSDLAYPVAYLREQGWPVGVIFPDRTPTAKLAPASLGDPNFTCSIVMDDLRASQMADPARDDSGAIIRSKTGRTFDKPDAW